jgi:hypothetical protein
MPLKGPDFRDFVVSLKRYPDTKPGPYGSLFYAGYPHSNCREKRELK